MSIEEVLPHVYVVILTSDKTKGTKLTTERYGGDHFALDENVHLVFTSDTAKTVSSKVGLGEGDEDGKATGAVFKLNSDLWGYDKPELWKWIRSAKDKRDEFATEVRRIFGIE